MAWLTSPKAPRYLSGAAGAYAFGAGLISFAGWVFGIYRLTDWGGSGIAIKANAALAGMLAGLALFLPRTRASRNLIRVLGLLVAIIGGLTLLEHLTGLDLAIDTLMFDEPPGAGATAAPGRMGPPASTTYLAIGTALILLTRRAAALSVSSMLGVGVLALSVLSLAGYWYGAAAMYAIPRLTGISMQMATIVAALGIGVIAANPERQPMRVLCEDSSAGMLARRLLPFVIIVPLVFGWVRVEGQRAGLYDLAFGAAMRSLVEVATFALLLWWSVEAIRARSIQQARAESDLRDSERRLAQTLASIMDGFIAFDREWRFIYVNPETERLLGRPRSQLIGRNIWEQFPEIVGSGLYREFHRAANERVMVEVDGAELAEGRRFALRIYPSFDGGVSVYFQDVTERKRAEEALKEADRRKDEFLATLAHELRNPLAPIRNAARVLLVKGLPDPSTQWSAEVISRQVQHMARLLDDLLDVSRISRNRLELRREWVDLASVIQSALEASRPVIDGAQHTLSVEVPSEPIYIDGDSIRLAQVFSNLLNNAAKYTEPGGQIGVTAQSTAQEAVVCVKDNGIGISPDMLARIFDLFTQAKPALQRSQGGLGIGLSLAKGMVELHGGRIEARSAGLGRGSEFIVRLPRVLNVERPAVLPLPGESLPQTISRRVLVVDDLKDSADSLSRLLEALGHDVHTVYSGEDALASVSGVRPEIIFLDLGMPSLNGFEVCRQIRQSPWSRDISIVALTGWGQPEDRRRTQEAGFDHHLIKPVDAGVLVSILSALPAASAVMA